MEYHWNRWQQYYKEVSRSTILWDFMQCSQQLEKAKLKINIMHDRDSKILERSEKQNIKLNTEIDKIKLILFNYKEAILKVDGKEGANNILKEVQINGLNNYEKTLKEFNTNV